MPERESSTAETRTLRRIALLVLRAGEDERDRSVSDRLWRIGAIIDHMKRDVALGAAASDGDVATLASLVQRLPATAREPLFSHQVVQQSVLTELRELVSQLCRERRPLPAMG